MTTTIGRTKLARDLESLARRFDAATAPGRPVRDWTPAALIVADALARLVTLLATWDKPGAARMADHVASALAPRAFDALRLAELVERYIPRSPALELARNLISALSDGVEDPHETIVAAIAHRREHFGLVISDELAESLTMALVRAFSPCPTAADLDELGAALRRLGRATADAALVHDRMLARAEARR